MYEGDMDMALTYLRMAQHTEYAWDVDAVDYINGEHRDYESIL